MGIKIDERLIKYNHSSRGGEKIKYIVVHDTGNTDHKSNADAHFNYFNGGDRQSSAHYFVDDKQILRVVKDSDKAWHCGDGNGKYGITNENSIGVEMCINSDGDFNKTYNNTLLLVKHLMDKYNILIDNVVRHYDASRKVCPHIWAKNNWSKWYNFKNDLLKIVNEDAQNIDYKPVITKLYQALFNRKPDNDGLNYWVDKVKSGYELGDVLKAMSHSEEFKSIYYI